MKFYGKCDLCSVEERIYQCKCNKWFCKYHHHILIHKCQKEYSVQYRFNLIENYYRCYACKNKHIILRCSCEGMYCLYHRHPEDHRCTFDHKSVELERLKNMLPLIQAAKIQKI